MSRRKSPSLGIDWRPFSTFVLLLMLAVGLSGCGEQLDLIPVRGTVLYQDKPLEFGSVMFQPERGGPAARGDIQADGSFVLSTLEQADGVQPGPSRVRVTAYDAQRPALRNDKLDSHPADEEKPLGESAIPRKYGRFGTSGIEIDVSATLVQPVIIRLE